MKLIGDGYLSASKFSFTKFYFYRFLCSPLPLLWLSPLTHSSHSIRLFTLWYLFKYSGCLYFSYSQLSSEKDFPQGASGKESTCQCRRHSRCGFDPQVRKIPMSTKWHLTPAFLPGKLCCSFEINVSNINIIHDKIYVFKANSREKCCFGMV